MANKDLKGNLTELVMLVKSYLKSYSTLMKLEALEKLSRAGTFIISSVIILMVAGFAVLFLAFAFSYWYGRTYNDYAGGFLIVAGFYLFIGITVFLLRKYIIGWPLLRSISKIIFQDEKSEEDEDE